MRSCLNCIFGSFHLQIDSHLYFYAGECGHWERAIRDQVLDAIEINSEDSAEIEQPFQAIGEQCPAWEARP